MCRRPYNPLLSHLVRPIKRPNGPKKLAVGSVPISVEVEAQLVLSPYLAFPAPEVGLMTDVDAR